MHLSLYLVWFMTHTSLETSVICLLNKLKTNSDGVSSHRANDHYTLITIIIRGEAISLFSTQIVSVLAISPLRMTAPSLCCFKNNCYSIITFISAFKRCYAFSYFFYFAKVIFKLECKIRISHIILSRERNFFQCSVVPFK